MTIWKDCAVMGLYTLSPTHLGTGQTTGAIDLPIARDAATGFPVVPATSLKGVLRDRAELVLDNAEDGKKTVVSLFGTDLDDRDRDKTSPDKGLTMGHLVVTEGRVIAYPVRSLARPFFHVTCPQVLADLARSLRAVGGRGLLDLDAAVAALATTTQALVGDETLAKGALVLEDLIFPAQEVAYQSTVSKVAGILAGLIPGSEAATRDRLSTGLVVVPDADFVALMQSAVPVQARIKLNAIKTTSKDEKGDSGNLWYEEALPSDCLFVALLGTRQTRASNGPAEGLATLTNALWTPDLVLQLGGNETVGYGLCLSGLVGPVVTAAAGGEGRS